MNDHELRDEINKRFTLNWLIQGAAQHTGMTLHYLVREELDAIDPELVLLYDQFALCLLLQFWHFEGVLLHGWPPRFWRRAASNPKHPFFGHPVLSRHGGMLAEAARRRGLERCKEKGFWALRFLYPLQVLNVVVRLHSKEASHSEVLAELAKKAATRVWGIPPDRLEAHLTHKIVFGNLSKPRTLSGRVVRSCAQSYGGVVRRGDSLVVVGRGKNWLLVAMELVQGTAELICLHGLNRLADDTYRQVIRSTDVVDYEPWMFQTGCELWRRLLAVLPGDRPVAEMLMHLALLPARSLEKLILAVIEEPAWARELLASLGASDAERGAESDQSRYPQEDSSGTPGS